MAHLIDVAVVGFGPVGATVAGLLAQHGHDVVVIDRDSDIYALPRAAHLDQDVLRIVQTLGCIDAVVPITRPNPGMDFLTADRQVLLSMRTSGRTPSGWPASSMFHQPGFDRALRTRAVELGARPHLGVTMTGLTDHGEHVRVDLGNDGSIDARWVIACDGAGSTARTTLGVDVDDLEFEESWLVLDLVLDEGITPPSELALQVCDPARPHTLVPMPAPRFRFEFMLLPGEDPAWMQRPEAIDGMLAAWIDPSTAHVERAASYTFHGLVATRWRTGRVLLAGDAAHQMPPFLGQGMCSGLRDAANLAWKLDLVLDRRAPDTLLDSYQAEREPQVRAIVDAAVEFGRLICTTDVAVAAERDEAMLAVRAADAADDAPPMPALAEGPLVLHGGGAQSLQVVVEGRRSDDVIAGRFAVVLRRATMIDDRAVQAWADLGAVVLDADRHVTLTDVLDAAAPGCDAVVIRPDSHLLFAGGECPQPPELLRTP